MRRSIVRCSSVAALAASLAGSVLAGPAAGADPLADCVAVVKITNGASGKGLPKDLAGASTADVTGFVPLQRQIAALNQPEDAPREQVVAAAKKQIALMRQERTLLLTGAGWIKDSELAGIIRDNGQALGAYAAAFEKVPPYSQENPQPDDVKAALQVARDHKNETGEAMTEKVADFCDFNPESATK